MNCSQLSDLEFIFVQRARRLKKQTTPEIERAYVEELRKRLGGNKQ